MKIHYLTLTLGLRSQDIAQYPLHHVTYSDTMFEVATSNSVGGDAFTRNTLFDLDLVSHEILPSTLYIM